MYEEEIQSFYVDMFIVDGDTILLKVNGRDFSMDVRLCLVRFLVCLLIGCQL